MGVRRTDKKRGLELFAYNPETKKTVRIPKEEWPQNYKNLNDEDLNAFTIKWAKARGWKVNESKKRAHLTTGIIAKGIEAFIAYKNTNKSLTLRHLHRYPTIFNQHVIPFFVQKHGANTFPKWRKLIPDFADHIRGQTISGMYKKTILNTLKELGRFLAQRETYGILGMPFDVDKSNISTKSETPLMVIFPPTFFLKKISQTKDPEIRFFLLATYGAALRPSETMALRVKNIILWDDKQLKSVLDSKDSEVLTHTDSMDRVTMFLNSIKEKPKKSGLLFYDREGSKYGRVVLFNITNARETMGRLGPTKTKASEGRTVFWFGEAAQLLIDTIRELVPSKKALSDLSKIKNVMFADGDKKYPPVKLLASVPEDERTDRWDDIIITRSGYETLLEKGKAEMARWHPVSAKSYDLRRMSPAYLSQLGLFDTLDLKTMLRHGDIKTTEKYMRTPVRIVGDDKNTSTPTHTLDF